MHAETSTGCQSDAKTLCEIARKYDALTIVDAVTSLAGTPVKVDEWGIDAIYSGSQKCLSCTPGLAPMSFSDRVVDLVKNRKEKVHSWFMDLGLLLGYWGATNRTYHHTAPTNALFALHEALLLVKEEGLENAWARHMRHHLALKAGLEAMGLKFLVAEGYRLPQMNAVFVPEGVVEAEVRRTLLDRIQSRNRRRARAARRQDLAFRPHGLFVQAGKRDAMPVGSRFSAVRHGLADRGRRRRSGGASRLCAAIRQGGATGEKARQRFRLVKKSYLKKASMAIQQSKGTIQNQGGQKKRWRSNNRYGGDEFLRRSLCGSLGHPQENW